LSRKSVELIICEENEGVFESKLVYSWQGYADKTNNRSILSLLETNSDNLRNQLQALLGSSLKALMDKIGLNQENLSQALLLFGSRFVEQSPFKTQIWLDGLRLLAFNQELDQLKCTRITYRGSSRSVHESLQKLCENRNLDYVRQFSRSKKSSISLVQSIWEYLPHWLRALIYLCRYLIIRWPIRQIPRVNWFQDEKTLFFFSYFFNLDRKEAEAGRFYSKQWEKLPQQLQSQDYRLNWMHLFMTSSLVPDAKTGIKWIERFRLDPEKQGCHALLDQYLDWKLVGRVLRDWIQSIIFFLHHRKQMTKDWNSGGFGWLCPIFQKEFENSMVGTVAMQNILWVHLLDKALASLPKQRIGLYLQENMCWERIFLYFWRKHGHGQIISVPHAIIRYWELSYFDTLTSKALKDLPQPDWVAVNGPHSWQMLKNSGYPMNRCIPVEALRYQYLSDIKPAAVRNASQISPQRLLVLGDINPETTNNMLLELESAYSELLAGIEVWIKPHPGNPVDLKMYPKLSATLTDKLLLELISEVDVALSSIFTSASLEVFCAGLPVLNFLDRNNLNLSPLRGHHNVGFVSSSKEILKHLADKQWLMSNSGANSKDFFWLDNDLKKWNKHIKKLIRNSI
jgi:surface carbohydrate biosynthesis protein (TIGR04326 family)